MKRFAMGWLPDRADFSDHTRADSGIARKLKSAAFPKGAKASPRSVDLHPWCSPVEDQGDLGSCTAQAAAAGLLEYHWLRANGELLYISRLFLYRTTRRLMGWNGGACAHLRDTMRAMVVVGVPPEQHWGHTTACFDDESEASCYAFAQFYRSLEHYRRDPPDTSGTDVLQRVKPNPGSWLLACRRSAVYRPIPDCGPSRQTVPSPVAESGDRRKGGHAANVATSA